MNDTEAFYDGFATKLVGDFLAGNRRMESAISFACDILKKQSRGSVLDLGCGIGWSTYEFGRACPTGMVHGIDLSPRLISIARRMFPETDRRRYFSGDLTARDWPSNGPTNYDACIMLDVYEHIPQGSRRCLHEGLSSVLRDDAVVIMTCPTPLHQAFLRTNKPEAVQPVDEDVKLMDVAKLAEEISAEITYFEYKSIWATNDYFHAVLNKKVIREHLVTRVPPHQLVPNHSRLKRAKLAFDVLGPEDWVGLRRLTPSLLDKVARRLWPRRPPR